MKCIQCRRGSSAYQVSGTGVMATVSSKAMTDMPSWV